MCFFSYSIKGRGRTCFLPLSNKDKMAGLPLSLSVMLIRVNIARDSVRLVHRLGKTQSIKQAV